MERLLVESAIRSVFVAVGVAGVLWATRMKAPAVLHAMWTLVMLAMLLLPLWTVWGPKAAMPMLPERPASRALPLTTSVLPTTPIQPGRRHCSPRLELAGGRDPCL